MLVYPLLKAIHFYEASLDIVNCAGPDDELIANYFVIRQDSMGLKFLSALYQAVVRGARVKLIIDSYGSQLDAGNGTEYMGAPLEGDLLSFLVSRGIEVFIYRPVSSKNIFHPFNLFRWKNYSRRNHNKVLTFNLKSEKRRGVIIGDTQWAMEHFNGEFIGHNVLVESNKTFVDAKLYHINLIHTEECVRFRKKQLDQFQERFWSKRLCLPMHNYEFTKTAKVFEVEDVEFVYSEISFVEMEKRRTIQDTEIKLLESNSGGVYCTPYFSPDKKMLKALSKFIMRGGKVFIGKYSNDPYLPYGVRRACESLFKKGLSIFEYRGLGNIHFKDLVTGDRSFIKSANGEGRSRFYNLDTGVIIRSKEFSEFMTQEIKRDYSLFIHLDRIEQVKIKHPLLERVFKSLIRPLFYHHL